MIMLVIFFLLKCFIENCFFYDAKICESFWRVSVLFLCVYKYVYVVLCIRSLRFFCSSIVFSK